MAGAEAGKTFKDGPDCRKMLDIPPGSFEMGSNSGEPDEQPLHNVTFSQPFAIGKTEVMQEQWRADGEKSELLFRLWR